MPQFSKHFEDHKTTILAPSLSIHNLPTNRARELFKSSIEAENLQASMKKSEDFWTWTFFDVV